VQERARSRAMDLAPTIQELQAAGCESLRAIASAPGHPEGERPPKTPTDAHKGGRIADENRSRAPKRRRLRSVTSSASSPAFDRVRQKPSCAFAHVCLRRSASIMAKPKTIFPEKRLSVSGPIYSLQTAFCSRRLGLPFCSLAFDELPGPPVSTTT
jgi:hypothetical protein